MRRFGIGLLCGIVGYFIAAIASYFLVQAFSPNMYDRSVEAAMTSAFFYGPLGAFFGLVGGVILGGRRPTVPGNDT